MRSQNEMGVDPCPVNLIADKVSNDDAFGHRGVADAIADMILNEERGCAIALTGAWGSGKSTVVGLLKDALEETSEDVGTFVFDAWAHQGDPLRRSFLEKLIDFCIDRNDWIGDKEYWHEITEELAKRKEQTKTVSSPNLTTLGSVGAILLLLAPAALQLYARNEFQYHPFLTGAGLFFGVLPALLALSATLFWSIKRRGKPEQVHPLASLFYTSSAIRTSTTSSKTIDPTSVEFEKRYRELLTRALRDSRRKLLIVVDNLDRVNHDDARSIWASMRVFFDPSTSRSTEWRNRVWVLVPFDPIAIKFLWDGDGGATNGAQLATHFLDKAFQATFRVPPVILTNRRDYLLSQLRAAFPKHTETEFHDIFRLYDRLACNGAEGPTPRNIKIFVNRLGSVHRQWQHRIPFTEQAAFVLWSERNESVFNVLPRSGGRSAFPNLPETISALLDEGWPRNFAALYFNVDPKDAYQVLLSEPIRKAIQARDKVKLVELEKALGFAEVLESTIEDICGASTTVDSTLVADAGVALSGLSGNWQGYENCIAHLYRAALSFEQWEPFGAEQGEGIKCLIEMAPPTSDISPLVRAIANSLRTSPKATSELNTTSWCAGLSILIVDLEARDKITLKRDLRVNAGPEQYIDLIKEVQKGPNSELIKKYLLPTDGMEPIFEHLSQKAASSQWNEYFAAAVTSILDIDPDFYPDTLINALRSRIVADHRTLATDLPKILETALLLSFSWTGAEQLLCAAAEGDSLYQILGLLPVGEEIVATAACVLPLLGNSIEAMQMFRPQPNTSQWSLVQGRQRALTLIQAPNSNQPLLQELGRVCLEFHGTSKWREICEAKPEQAPFISQFLGIRLSGENAMELEIDEMVQHTGFWRSAIGQEGFTSALDRKAKSGELSAALIQRPFDINNQDLYADALLKNDNAAYREFLMKALKEVTEDNWAEALREASELITMASRLLPFGLVLAQEFQDALASHAEWLFLQDEIGSLSNIWQSVPKLLRNEGQAVLKQRLWNSFSSESGNVAGVIPYYGELLSTAVLRFGPQSAFKRIVQIITRHREAEIKWLRDTLSNWSPRSEEGKASQRDWQKRVAKILEEEKDTINTPERLALEALGDALKPKSRLSRSSSK